MDLYDVKIANKKINQHWFDKKAMRFFNTRIESKLIKNCFFITSEQPPYGLRSFAIRFVKQNGSIETSGGICQFSTKKDAKEALKILVEKLDKD